MATSSFHTTFKVSEDRKEAFKEAMKTTVSLVNGKESKFMDDDDYAALKKVFKKKC